MQVTDIIAQNATSVHKPLLAGKEEGHEQRSKF